MKHPTDLARIAMGDASSGPWRHPTPKPKQKPSAWVLLIIVAGAFAWVGIVLAWVLT